VHPNAGSNNPSLENQWEVLEEQSGYGPKEKIHMWRKT
jgi:hypothetical protein